LLDILRDNDKNVTNGNIGREMIPAFVLATAFLVSWSVGGIVYPPLKDWHNALSAGLSVMFFVTASAHWGRRRQDLVRMVPPKFPSPERLVTVTGVLEIAGALGLFLPRVRPVAALCLASLLVIMLPANLHASRAGLSIGGRPVMKSWLRVPLQIVFIACLVAVIVRTR
jgi:uncharacterized membrane protein